MSHQREHRGIDIVARNGVQCIDRAHYRVQSQSRAAEWHDVAWQRTRWVCSCEDHTKTGRKCKHIHAVAYFLGQRQIVLGAGSVGTETRCPECQGTDGLIKRGIQYNRDGPVQRYSCKKCNVRFAEGCKIKGRNRIAAIATALDLYFRGLSLRQIAEHLEMIYGETVTHTAIANWVKRYVELVQRYLRPRQGASSERWHADETMIRVHGRQMVLWGLLDSKTRRILATSISRGRGVEEARDLFERGMQSNKTRPLEVVTDGLPSYAAVLDEGKGPIHPLIHIQGPLAEGHNNRMERLWRTVKDRTKPLARFSSEDGAERFFEGFSIHYNYARGHQALGGRTPAEEAGLAEGKLRWMDMIHQAAQVAAAERVGKAEEPEEPPPAATKGVSSGKGQCLTEEAQASDEGGT